jgi:hypothetical protein
MIPKAIKQVYSLFKDYTYQEPDFTNYKIKIPSAFNKQRGGICYDFVGPIALELDKCNIPWECFYTVVKQGEKTLATHTYIIADNKYWIECSWQPYKGINIVDSYHDIEDLLKDYYGGTEIHTFSYDPTQTFGLTLPEFYHYLEQEGEYKGESNMHYRKESELGYIQNRDKAISYFRDRLGKEGLSISDSEISNLIRRFIVLASKGEFGNSAEYTHFHDVEEDVSKLYSSIANGEIDKQTKIDIYNIVTFILYYTKAYEAVEQLIKETERSGSSDVAYVAVLEAIEPDIHS